uniref:Uncharacterized protein n=1 Tax=Fibrocapsa japonica TaxID=94617 RepID=A0A7S2UU90_9STRA|mmetsp:Transcript_13721/g.20200  ORF Transcript_13721/g.20200 Transcript_13721/m.20200 type:complete len:210 (+) Transcript_13721:219-848(+)|eukprot:CAMPEP_0113936754 /NCGR_PEP_ID=MMETSP1339-20121228/3557_1 /TAXON_ID=94617 /ORGANISM="Fibrocapsa japonica" /LENGTH=209 /DNA_ID=CAMNT_0000939305 /DNA_START=147 /DNA_END=776 /DNA_ORIENTATION=+ /assembly_acc=CAM_ASM_000762
MFSKVLALAAVAGMASAFVPSAPLQTGVAKSSSALKMTFETEVGAQNPLGFFDPLGLLDNADQERFDRLRFVELKHGRISMLAVVGHLVQNNVRLPGYISTSADLKFADIPNGLAAFSKIPPLGVVQLVTFVGLLEAGVWKQQDSGIPGDFGLRWTQNFTEEEKYQKRAIELNNGRAAMMGILALMVHEKLDNHPYVINDLVGASYTFN